MAKNNLLTEKKAFQFLKENAENIPHIAEIFDKQPARGKDYIIQAEGITLDISKQRVNDDSIKLLCDLYYESNVPENIEMLFNGSLVNKSENRAALHTQLRVPKERQEENYNIVNDQLDHMELIVNQIHNGTWRGFSGKRITDVVNLGVGGSDLGPLMVCHALREYSLPSTDSLNVHFASTIDGSQLFGLLKDLKPETTVFLIASKSFTTIDTLSNANTARSWLLSVCPNKELMLRCHFIGISSSAEKMSEWGIVEKNQLSIWDWVGGRYSLWSSVGLSIALALGMPLFRELLKGAHSLDEHYRTSPPEKNIPVMMALIGIWNVNILNIKAQAILPYDGRLKYFPSYLTQLEMESNGKSVTQDGEPIDYSTCPILWGEVGANAQHAFYQLLHQGTQSVAADFILAAKRYDTNQDDSHKNSLVAQHELNISNCLAQSRVLAFGNYAIGNNSNPFRNYPGNQPSSTLVLPKLDAFTLGSLIACYEHKVFTQAVIWGINPFDQWGVELGKQVASQLKCLFSEDNEPNKAGALDSSTLALASMIQDFRKE